MGLILRVRFGNKFDEEIEIIEKVYISCVPRIVFQYIQAFSPASGPCLALIIFVSASPPPNLSPTVNTDYRSIYWARWWPTWTTETE